MFLIIRRFLFYKKAVRKNIGEVDIRKCYDLRFEKFLLSN